MTETLNYSMPTAEDLEFLTRGESEHSLSMYLDTDGKFNLNDLRTKAKSLFNDALRNSHLELSRQHKERLSEQYEAAVATLTSHRGNSTAVFVNEQTFRVYHLPNHLQDSSRLSRAFYLKPLFRALSFAREALLLNITIDGWELYEVRNDSRLTPVQIDKDGIENWTEATNRHLLLERSQSRNQVGLDDRSSQYERYVSTVVDAVKSWVATEGKNSVPLIVFASKALPLSKFEFQNPLIIKEGGSYGSAPVHELDRMAHDALTEYYVAQVDSTIDTILSQMSAGRTKFDIADIAMNAVQGRIKTLVYLFDTTLLGTFDTESGAVSYDEDGENDLLNRLALTVFLKGGELLAVRPEETSFDFSNSPVLAQLR